MVLHNSWGGVRLASALHSIYMATIDAADVCPSALPSGRRVAADGPTAVSVNRRPPAAPPGRQRTCCANIYLYTYTLVVYILWARREVSVNKSISIYKVWYIIWVWMQS